MEIDTRTIQNFLSDDEIEYIENFVMTSNEPWENWNPTDVEGVKVMSGHYYVFDYYDEKNSSIKNILQPKFDKEFGKDLHIQQIHIFDSFDPYKIHSDVDSAGDVVKEAPNPAWTLIIPLFDVLSHTIVFNEQSEIKSPEHYMKTHKPYDKPTIDYNTYVKYFSHTPYSYYDWLSIEDIFQWKKGACFAASRFKFHTSDNFLAHGIKNKRALIAWTSLP